MAPTDAVWAAHPRAQQMLEEIPPFLHADPDVRAVIYCYAREAERKEATLDGLIAEFFPRTATSLGLPLWEALLRITQAPSGATDATRRNTVEAYLQKLSGGAEGSDWVANVTKLVGPGWTYEEHDPANPSSPPNYTVRVYLPYAPSSGLYSQLEQLLRDITPWHLDLELFYTGGFLWDVSQFDQEGWG